MQSEFFLTYLNVATLDVEDVDKKFDLAEDVVSLTVKVLLVERVLPTTVP